MKTNLLRWIFGLAYRSSFHAITRLSTFAAQMFLIFLAASKETVCSTETRRSRERNSGGRKKNTKKRITQKRKSYSMARAFAALLEVIAISRPYKNTISVIAKNKKTSRILIACRLGGDGAILYLRRSECCCVLFDLPPRSGSEGGGATGPPWPSPGLLQKRPCLAESRSLETASRTADLGARRSFLSPSSVPCVPESAIAVYLILPCRSGGRRTFSHTAPVLHTRVWGEIIASLSPLTPIKLDKQNI